MKAGLAFWLRTVNADGGLAECIGDTTLVMMPPKLQEAYGLPGEVEVTDDPDVARDDHGFILTGQDILTLDRSQWPLSRSPFLLETSLPGVFAAGDVRLESMKRVASAVGEGAMSVYLVHRYLTTV